MIVFFFQAYISCALGVHRVGYVMICFGVVNAACSLVFGSLMKFVGRQSLMVLGAIVHVSLIVVLLHWKPHPDNPYVFYTVSGLWGVGDAVWQTQVNGMYKREIYFIQRKTKRYFMDFHTYVRNLKLESVQTVCKNIYKVSRIGCIVIYRYLRKTNFYLASIF